MNKETLEFRWHGRGGQGAVTASKMLAETALEEGKYFLGNPDYGAERMGAPIQAYTRISIHPVKLYCQITEPDVVLVLDSTLLGVVDVLEGLKEDGIVILNSPLSPVEARSRLNPNGKLYTVDATGIAMDILGRNLPNVPMLGAVTKVTGAVNKDTMASVIRSRLGATMKQKVVDGNVAAFEKAYDNVRAE